jgi:transcriptional regulator with XRE-family HTH domain
MPSTPTLKAEMEARSLTYRSLGYLTGLSGAYICRVANGRRRASKKATLAIATALGMAPTALERILGNEVADK